MKPLLALVLFLAPPPATDLSTPVRRPTPVDTELSVKIVPPDGLYDVTVKPKAPATGATVGVWTIAPRKGVNTIARSRAEWHFKAPAGHYEVLYTVISGDDQNDSYLEFDTGPPKPPDPPPPDPTDPDMVRLKAAYDSDTPTDAGLRKLNAAALATYYRDAATVCRNSTAANVADFFKEINVKAQSERVGLGLPKVRNEIVAPALRAVFPPPTNGAQTVSAIQRLTLAGAFDKYAALLEAVK